MLVEKARSSVSGVKVYEHNSIQTLNRTCTCDGSSPYHHT